MEEVYDVLSSHPNSLWAFGNFINPWPVPAALRTFAPTHFLLPSIAHACLPSFLWYVRAGATGEPASWAPADRSVAVPLQLLETQ